MNDFRVARNDDAPYSPDFWDDADRAYFALTTYHQDGEVLDAASIFLCSSRDPADVSAFIARIEAIGEQAKSDYIAERTGAPE